MTHMSWRTVWVRSTRCEASQQSWIPPSYSSTAVTYPGHNSNLTKRSVFIAKVMNNWISTELWWKYGEMGKIKYSYNTCPSTTLCTINPTQTGLGFNFYSMQVESGLQSALHLHTVQLLIEGDDTRGCGDTIGPPEDGQRAARNMLRSIV